MNRTTLKILLLVGVAVLLALIVLRGEEDTWLCDVASGTWVQHGAPSAPAPNEPCGGQTNTHADISVSEPAANATITSPLAIVGEARGTWFFEASAPVVLVDWDGRIIAEGYIQAQGDPEDGSADGAGWMTTDFVPFVGTLEFESPYKAGDADFMQKGTLILRKDNPSGMPEHDDAIEIPVLF